MRKFLLASLLTASLVAHANAAALPECRLKLDLMQESWEKGSEPYAKIGFKRTLLKKIVLLEGTSLEAFLRQVANERDALIAEKKCSPPSSPTLCQITRATSGDDFDVSIGRPNSEYLVSSGLGNPASRLPLLKKLEASGLCKIAPPSKCYIDPKQGKDRSHALYIGTDGIMREYDEELISLKALKDLMSQVVKAKICVEVKFVEKGCTEKNAITPCPLRKGDEGSQEQEPDSEMDFADETYTGE